MCCSSPLCSLGLFLASAIAKLIVCTVHSPCSYSFHFILPYLHTIIVTFSIKPVVGIVVQLTASLLIEYCIIKLIAIQVTTMVKLISLVNPSPTPPPPTKNVTTWVIVYNGLQIYWFFSPSSNAEK